MIIKLKNLSIPFHRLGLGAILISPDDSRYLKSLTDDAEFCWVTATDAITAESVLDSTMKRDIGDGKEAGRSSRDSRDREHRVRR